MERTPERVREAGGRGPRPVDAMIAGAQKAGTSSLHRYLGQHPAIVTHSQREMTYFVVDREHGESCSTVYDRYFPRRPGASDVVLAKSAGVMFYSRALDRLHAHNPDCRIIVSLRNPVDRAYSAYWFMRRKGREPADSFEEALSRVEGRAIEGWRDGQGAYLRRGLYAEQLTRLTERFGRDRWKAILLEDLRADAEATCRALFQFLGIDPDFQPDVDRRHNPARTARLEVVSRMMVSDHPIKRALARLVPFRWKRTLRRFVESANEAPFRPPPMSPQTRERLVEYFRPHNERLARMLDRDLSSWHRSDSASGKT